MSTFTPRNAGFTLALIGGLTACQGNAAPDVTAPAPATVVRPEPISPPPTLDSEATTIPDSADAIWLAINQKSAELKATIANGDMKNVHHQAFAIRDLVAALPSHSPTLPAEDATKLQSEIKFVSTLADRLDETGDAGDRAESQANYDKLVTVLDGITRNK